MIETREILQTMHMIQQENFDIRTITLGINLLDCSDRDADKCAERVYEKICRTAANLVRTGEEIETELGIPIVNKRISVTPVSLICQDDPRPIALALDRAAAEVGVNFLGGYSALMHKGATLADERLLASIPEVLSETKLLCSSVNVASTRAGINMNAVKEMGEIIKKTAELTAEEDGLGCAKLVVFANAVEDNPFMAGAFCGVGEPECAINVGRCGNDQADGFQDYPRGPAGGQGSKQTAEHSLRHCGSEPCADAGEGRLRCPYPDGNGAGECRRAGNDGSACAAERRSQKRRYHGQQPCGRPERRLYPGQ